MGRGWLYVGGDGPGNYSTIQNAIAAASTGDTIFVYNGTYIENIIIDKSLELIGENRNTTFIDGNMKGDTVTILSEKVLLLNFTILNGKTTIKLDVFRAGIRLTESHCVIKGNRLKDNQIGILGLRVTNSTIVDNQLYGNGITFSPYENVDRPKISLKYFMHNISNNTVNDKPLLYLLNQKNKDVTDPAGQIIAVNCSNITFKNYEMTQPNTDSAILLAYCSNCIIEKSNISNNSGIWTFKSNNNIYRNNTFSHNFHGITLDYSSNNNVIECNTIYNNHYAGVMLEYYSKNNLIQKNNIIKNTYNGYFTQAFQNKWHANYYDRWTGLQYSFLSCFPKIIIGRIIDANFPPTPWINFDWHPAKTPYDIPRIAI